MMQRQRVGIERARAAGRYKGRAPALIWREAEVRKLYAEGMSQAAIGRKFGVSHKVVWMLLHGRYVERVA